MVRAIQKNRTMRLIEWPHKCYGNHSGYFLVRYLRIGNQLGGYLIHLVDSSAQRDMKNEFAPFELHWKRRETSPLSVDLRSAGWRQRCPHRRPAVGSNRDGWSRHDRESGCSDSCQVERTRHTRGRFRFFAIKEQACEGGMPLRAPAAEG